MPVATLTRCRNAVGTWVFQPGKGSERDFVRQVGQLIADRACWSAIERHNFLFRFVLPREGIDLTAAAALHSKLRPLCMAAEDGADGMCVEFDGDIRRAITRRLLEEQSVRVMALEDVFRHVASLASGSAIFLHDAYLARNWEPGSERVQRFVDLLAENGARRVVFLTSVRDHDAKRTPLADEWRALCEQRVGPLHHREDLRVEIQGYSGQARGACRELAHARWAISRFGGVWVDTGFLGGHERSLVAMPISWDALMPMLNWMDQVKRTEAHWRVGPAV